MSTRGASAGRAEKCTFGGPRRTANESPERSRWSRRTLHRQ